MTQLRFCIERLGIVDLRYALAFEEAVFRRPSMEGPSLWALVWSPRPALSIGRTQGYCEEVRCRKAEEAGVPIVRRHTGGGSVFVDEGNVAFSIVFRGERNSIVSPGEVYSVGSRVIIEALAREGVKASVENVTDIVVGGWKVAGTAARISRGSWVFHAIILVHSNMELVDLLKPPLWRVVRGETLPSKYRPRPLDTLRSGIDWEGVATSLVEVTAETWGVDEAGEGACRRPHGRVTSALYKGKYRERAWNVEGKDPAPTLLQQVPL